MKMKLLKKQDTLKQNKDKLVVLVMFVVIL